jgi:hypothetical protein
LYARLTADAIDRLSRSQQFKRGIDNFAYHKGYPRNYRGRGGVPSIQFSIALDGRRADVDVDYRGSSFPVSLFNGHLTAANSDVRAGNNFDRHADRWTGFQNWWRSFFGVREQRAPQEADRPSALALPPTPRAGNKTIDAMTQDFLQAWLIEGDIVAAMGYVSERSYACLAQEAENPGSFDRGTAPYQLMMNLKSAHDTLGAHASLESLVVGTRLTVPGLRVVTQPYHAQFVIYSVPDDVAAAFDCESRLTPAAAAKVERAYGTYFGTTFFIDGERDYSVALLWAKDQGYWKIVSWRTAENGDPAPAPPPVREPRPARIGADRTLVDAARAFLDAWLVRRQYDTALTYVSPKTNGCYNLERGPDSAPATSSEDARQKIRAGFETIAEAMAANTTLEAMIAAPEPAHPLVRVMSHRYDRVFGLTGLPSALADAVECDAREQDLGVPDPLPLEYGKAFGMTMRFKMRSGDAPILRLLWRREPEGWRITSYDVELP